MEAQTLRSEGYQVSVISPDYGKESFSGTIDGIHVYRYPKPPSTKGFLSYFIEFAYCWLYTLYLCLRVHFERGFDVIHACNPPDTFFGIGLIFKLFGKKFVFDQHDLCPELYLSRFNGKSGGLVHSVLLQLEKLTYRTADVVLATNRSYREIAISRGGIPEDRVFVVRTGPDLARLKQVAPDESLRRGRDHLVCYLGVMGPQDGVDYLLSSIDHIVNEKKRTDIQFALIGNGDVFQDMVKLADDLGVGEYVEFPGRVPDDQLLTFLSTSDVCVQPDPKNELNDHSTMNKVLEYMAVARPIVAYDLVETRYSAGEAALFATPNDKVDFAENILYLLDNEEIRDRMGQEGLKRIKDELSWDKTKEGLINAYRKVMGRGPGTC